MLESAIVMARRAMDAVGVDGAEIDKTEAEYRRRDYERLKLQRETGDIYAARDSMFSQAGQAAAAEADLEQR
jgi:CPA2 family monovalent cation:H+ antiporter-2/glutathione-regulated potassium-efflux system protein KefB